MRLDRGNRAGIECQVVDTGTSQPAIFRARVAALSPFGKVGGVQAFPAQQRAPCLRIVRRLLVLPEDPHLGSAVKARRFGRPDHGSSPEPTVPSCAAGEVAMSAMVSVTSGGSRLALLAQVLQGSHVSHQFDREGVADVVSSCRCGEHCEYLPAYPQPTYQQPSYPCFGACQV